MGNKNHARLKSHVVLCVSSEIRGFLRASFFSDHATGLHRMDLQGLLDVAGFPEKTGDQLISFVDRLNDLFERCESLDYCFLSNTS